MQMQSHVKVQEDDMCCGSCCAQGVGGLPSKYSLKVLHSFLETVICKETMYKETNFT